MRMMRRTDKKDDALRWSSSGAVIVQFPRWPMISDDGIGFENIG
jgi:hypothetical protein